MFTPSSTYLTLLLSAVLATVSPMSLAQQTVNENQRALSEMKSPIQSNPLAPVGLKQLFTQSNYALSQSPLYDIKLQSGLARLKKSPQDYIDSHNSSQDSQPIFTRLQDLYLLSQAFLYADEATNAIITLNDAIELSQMLESPERPDIIALLYESLSDAYISSGQMLKARLAISDAISQTELPAQQSTLVQRLQKRALIDFQGGASISALQDLQLALQIASSTELAQQEVALATLITVIHQQRNEHAIALSYSERASNIAKEQNDEQALLQVLITSMPSLLSSNQWQQAQSQLTQINQLLFDNPNLASSAKALQFAGELAYNQGDITLAIDKLSSALRLFSGEGLKQSSDLDIAHTQLLLSRAYTELDDMDAAIEHLVAAFNAIPLNTNDFDLVQNIHLHRAELLGRLNQFEEAFRVTKDVLAARNINQPINEIKRMLDMHTNFQLQLQQQENIELKQKNEFQSSEIESKQTLNRLFFLVIALLICISCLLLLMFIRARRHREKLEQIAHTDALTGIFSRRRILEILEFQQDMFNRNELAYCVAIIDLDFFKNINDHYGHQTGDEVLKGTASLATQTFRKTDSVGRIGGEEFLFIFPDTTLEQAKPLLEKYCEHLVQVGKDAKIKQSTTASVGLVEAQKEEATSSIISRADKALYEAKNNGRDQIVVGASPKTDLDK